MDGHYLGFIKYAPNKLIGDYAYDSDELDQRLLDERSFEMVAPHRKNGKPKFWMDAN